MWSRRELDVKVGHGLIAGAVRIAVESIESTNETWMDHGGEVQC